MNIKKGRNPIRKEFGTFDLTSKDLKNLQKIILKRIKPADSFINVGKPRGMFSYVDHNYDKVSLIPSRARPIRYLEIKTKVPNVSIEFTPLHTKLLVTLAYSKGDQLNALNEIGREVEEYFTSLKLQRKNTGLAFPRSLRRNKIIL